jgi:FKBP-type peptidyl-prolyl cis-trans isomerase
MKPPKSLKISDNQLGTGRIVAPGDVVVCHCRCRLRKGDLVFASSAEEPYVICVGRRDFFVGVACGLLGMQQGGIRTIKVSPNLTYHERRIYPDIPEDAMLIYEIELIRFQDQRVPEK